MLDSLLAYDYMSKAKLSTINACMHGCMDAYLPTSVRPSVRPSVHPSSLHPSVHPSIISKLDGTGPTAHVLSTRQRHPSPTAYDNSYALTGPEARRGLSLMRPCTNSSSPSQVTGRDHCSAVLGPSHVAGALCVAEPLPAGEIAHAAADKGRRPGAAC